MQVRHASARRVRRAFVHDAAAQRRASRADDLRHGAPKVVGANAIDAPEVAEEFVPAGSRMRRRDADNRASGHDEDDGGNEKRPAPADPGRDRRRDRSRDRDADIAADAVARHRMAAVDGLLHHHRRADRMINRAEHADAEQRDGEQREVRRGADRRRRDAGTNEKDRHHIAPAPVVGEPARRQREQAERGERRRRERQQIAVAAAVDRLQPDHHGREDQDDVVVEEVRPIEKPDGAAAGGLFENGGVGSGSWGHEVSVGELRFPRLVGREAPGIHLPFGDVRSIFVVKGPNR